jgi:hypothetical protein
MTEGVGVASSWIPVIGTLSGAIVGFLASFTTSWWNNKQLLIKSKEERKREKLEDAYKTLIAIDKDYKELLGQIINNIHHNKDIIVNSHTEIPPLIKFEMLVALYLPQLNVGWQKLIKSKDEFSEEYAKVIGENFQTKPLKLKQELTIKFLCLHGNIIQNITSLQKEVATIIKP